jgi:glycosyltransferase involved in cell wall biosynthesis
MWVGFSTDTGAEGGNMLTQLRRQAAVAGLGERMVWVGPVPYAQLPRYYAESDMLVAPSRFEPFGMVYLEAMAAGCPVVASAAGGVPEIVQHGKTGQLVPPDDASALASAISNLLAAPGRRRQISLAALGEVRRRFSLPVISRATAAHYEELLSVDQREAA